VELDIVPLEMCGVVFGSPYMYRRYVIFTCPKRKLVPSDQEWGVLTSSMHTRVN
jgi:hypothetical protein